MHARDLTPREVRVARSLLGWSQERLAARSETTTAFVWAYEREGRVMRMHSRDHSLNGLAAIRTTLEAAGIEFTDGEQPGVRLSELLADESSAITPDQMRNARVKLGWSRENLSSASKATVAFIKGYEDLGRVGRLNLRRSGFDGLAAIRSALEKAGIDFTNGEEPGVARREAGSS